MADDEAFIADAVKVQKPEAGDPESVIDPRNVLDDEGNIVDPRSIVDEDGTIIDPREVVDADGDTVISPRRENGHGSDRFQPTHVDDGSTVTGSGAKHVEGFLDYESLDFGLEHGAAAIASLTNQSTTGGADGSTALGATGGLIITSAATPGSMARFVGPVTVGYDDNVGHVIANDQTFALHSTSAALTGNAYILTGLINLATDDAFGWGADATGIFTYTRRGGVLTRRYQPEWIGDKCDGNEPSVFGLLQPDGSLVRQPLNPLNMNYLRSASQFLYAAPAYFSVDPPYGNGLLFCDAFQNPNNIALPSLRSADLNTFVEIHPDGAAIATISGSWRTGVFTNRVAIAGRDDQGIPREATVRLPSDNQTQPGYSLGVNAYQANFDSKGTPSNRWNRARGLDGIQRVKTYPDVLDSPSEGVTAIAGSSTELIAALSSNHARIITFWVDPESLYGVHLHFGNGNATTGDPYIPPGKGFTLACNTRIAMIRHALATVDVDVHWFTGQGLTP